MRRLTLPLSLLMACGAPTGYEDEFSSRVDPIINGEACPVTTLPATVAILSDGVINMFGQQQEIRSPSCTGTLIAPDVVLAAAHCVDMSLQTMGIGTVVSEAYAVTFQADLSALSQGTTTEFPPDTVYVSKWIAHPRFSISALNNVSGPGDYRDIALLFLETPITHVQPEIIITAEEVAQLQVGSVLEIAGYGMTTIPVDQFTPPPAGSVGKKMCATSFVNELGATEMQVGSDASSRRKCHGDSGGPSYLTVDTPHDVKRRVVGVTSHAYDERDCNVGGVDTRVDAYRDWLETELVRGCTQGARAWCDVQGIIPPEYFDEGYVYVPPPEETPGSGGDARPSGCGCGASPAGAFALLLGLCVRRWRSRSRAF